MDSPLLLVLLPLFLLVGGLYASVGHAGASGYLAIMALAGVDAAFMRPTALAINILVATIALVQFARAGHFSMRLLWPFVVLSVPAAYFGAWIKISDGTLRATIGAVLLLSAARMGYLAWKPPVAQTVAKPPALPIALAAGGVIGFIAGMTGTGGGIFLSPLLLMLNWADTKRTAAIAPAFILINSIAALAALVQDGWRPTPAVGALALAAGIGGAAGAYLGSRHLGNRGLRGVLAIVLASASVKLLTSA